MSGISSKAIFYRQPLLAPPIAVPASNVFPQLAQISDAKPEAAAAATRAGGQSAADAMLSQVLGANGSALKAAAIATFVARRYAFAQAPTCSMPPVDCSPKPPLAGTPDYRPITPPTVVQPVQPPATYPPPGERRFAGDDLGRQLEAGGAAIVSGPEGWGVSSGRPGDLASEIDPGECLVFHVPSGGRASSGAATIGCLFSDGPDQFRQEQGTVEVYDGDNLVKTIDLRGFSATNGQQTVDVDVPFTRLVFKAKGAFVGNGNHSDLTLKEVMVRQAPDVPTLQPQPEPKPQPPYMGIPRFEPPVSIGPIYPPAAPPDPFVAPAAIDLQRLAGIVDTSALPENVQVILLDRIATMLADLHRSARDKNHWSTAVVGFASLIQTLETALPRNGSTKFVESARHHVMGHLQTMLAAAALRRDGEMHALSVA